MPNEPKKQPDSMIFRRVQEGGEIRKGALNTDKPTARPTGKPAAFGPAPAAAQSPTSGATSGKDTTTKPTNE
jgi:hypothetical protein